MSSSMLWRMFGFPSLFKADWMFHWGLPSWCARTRLPMQRHKRWTHQYLFGILLEFFCVYTRRVGLLYHMTICLFSFLEHLVMVHFVCCLVEECRPHRPPGPSLTMTRACRSVHLTLTFCGCSGPQSWSQSPWANTPSAQDGEWDLLQHCRPHFHSLGVIFKPLWPFVSV